MSVAATRRAGKRIALRYGKPHRARTDAENMGAKKGTKVAKVRSAVRAKVANKK